MSNTERVLNLYKQGKISDATMVKVAAFKKEIEDFLNGEFEKTAANMAKIILLSSLAGPAFAAGHHLMGKAISKFEQAGAGPRDEQAFKRMMEFRPSLKNEDPLLVRKYWDSLNYFAPAIAQDSLAAAAYIVQVIGYDATGGPPYSTIESLVNTQKRFRESHPLKTITLGEAVADRASRSLISP